MNPSLLERIVEAALMAANKPLAILHLQQLFDDSERPSKSQLEQALAAIAQNSEARGFELKEVASGWRFQVCQELTPWVARLWDERPQKYSRALLETLALVSYRQPITRGDIENIRGVAVSSNIMRTLLDRGWVKVVGHRDVPGRPAMYATTREFLDYFNLKSLDQLPTLSEIRDLDNLNQELNLSSDDNADRAQADANARNDKLLVDVENVSKEAEEPNAPSVQDDLLVSAEKADESSIEPQTLASAAQENDSNVNDHHVVEATNNDDQESNIQTINDSIAKQEIDREMSEDVSASSKDILDAVANMQVDDAFDEDQQEITDVKPTSTEKLISAKDVFASVQEPHETENEETAKDAFNDDALVHYSDDIDPAFLEDDD